MTILPASPPVRQEGIHWRSKDGASLLDVRDAMTTLKHELLAQKVEELDIACVEIVVAEILNNIVKHAQDDIDNGWFELWASKQRDGIQIMCRDNGKPMPGGSPPGGTMPSVNRERADLPEGGWGWSLVRALTKNLNYVRMDRINLVSLTVPAAHPSTTH